MIYENSRIFFRWGHGSFRPLATPMVVCVGSVGDVDMSHRGNPEGVVCTKFGRVNEVGEIKL